MKKLEDFRNRVKEEFNDLEDRDRRLYKTSIFLGKLLIAGLVFQSLLFLYPTTYSVQTLLAQSLAPALELIGIPVKVQGFLLVGEKASYLISQDCLGWKSMAAFVGLMFASTSEYREHLKYMLGGILFLAVMNWVRIFSTIYLSHAGLLSFDIVHTFLWRWALTILVIGIWALWITKTSDSTQF